MIAEEIHIESDEAGFELHILDGEGELLIVNIHGVAEELYDQAKTRIGPWLDEMYAAKAEFDSGRASDPSQQAVLDRIKGDHDGPWPGESVMAFYQRTGQEGPLLEVADAMNKARKENG